MNLGNGPADQVVRFTLEGTEVVLKLSGLAAKNFAMFAYAVLRDQKKTRGKTRLVRMLKEQRPFKFFQIPVQFRKEFAKEARRHGLLYVPIRNKRNRSELELVVFADDAAKVNRILDNLNLDFVCSQAGEAAVEHPEETGGRAPDLVPPAPVRNEAVSIGNEQVEFELGGFDEAFSLSSAAREADTENFTQGRERNGNPSEPFSRGRGSSPDWEGDDRTPGRKESVKKLLREIRQEQAQCRTKREERRGPEHTAPARSRKRKKKRQKGR